ncbi:MAG: hypothetical protein GF372_12880 [Candidatus Marinimicrobia bacterium]|nr:hypothetical protein [Candidatus Neomarinimicrobiota bacterium]
MKELTVEEMMEIRGGEWDTEEFLCNMGFTQLGFWNGLAVGYAFGNLPGAVVGLGFGIAGNIVCSLATS